MILYRLLLLLSIPALPLRARAGGCTPNDLGMAYPGACQYGNPLTITVLHSSFAAIPISSPNLGASDYLARDLMWLNPLSCYQAVFGPKGLTLYVWTSDNQPPSGITAANVKIEPGDKSGPTGQAGIFTLSSVTVESQLMVKIYPDGQERNLYSVSLIFANEPGDFYRLTDGQGHTIAEGRYWLSIGLKNPGCTQVIHAIPQFPIDRQQDNASAWNGLGWSSLGLSLCWDGEHVGPAEIPTANKLTIKVDIDDYASNSFQRHDLFRVEARSDDNQHWASTYVRIPPNAWTNGIARLDAEFVASELPLNHTYDVMVKLEHSLSRKVLDVPSDNGSSWPNVPSASLIMGDADGDDAVTTYDYNLLSAAFDSMLFAEDRSDFERYNFLCDFDGDDAVTVWDYNILSANYDLTGDTW